MTIKLAIAGVIKIVVNDALHQSTDGYARLQASVKGVTKVNRATKVDENDDRDKIALGWTTQSSGGRSVKLGQRVLEMSQEELNKVLQEKIELKKEVAARPAAQDAVRIKIGVWV